MSESGENLNTQISESTKKELPEEQKNLRDLFRLSFRFSQGDKNLQNKILEWLALNGEFNNLNVPEHPPSYILSITAPERHTDEFGQREKESTQTEIKQRWDYLYFLTISNGKDKLSSLEKDQVLEEIFSGLLERDSNYQIDPRPNRARNNESKPTPDSDDDPHASFLRRYALKRELLNVSAYDNLLKHVSDIFIPKVKRVDQEQAEKDISDPPAPEELDQQRQIGVFQKFWERNHLGESFLPDELAT